VSDGHLIRIFLLGVLVAAMFIFFNLTHRLPRRRLYVLQFKCGGFVLTIKGKFMAKLMRGMKLPFSVVPIDSGGVPAQIDPNPGIQATSSDETVAKVENLNGTDFAVHWIGPGTALIQVSADADLGDGVSQIVGSGQVECVGGTAVGFDIEFGTPVAENPTTAQPAP
jgi:hypothetical protein